MANTIDEVVDRLGEVVEGAAENNSRLGYFPALYRKVTMEVGERIRDGFFDDGPRMERLDVVFANRYLDAVDAWQKQRPTTGAWRFAFTTSGEFWPIVLQHLLLGMNAHINLDLGIAAARTVAPHELDSLQGDFNRINSILASLVSDVQKELEEIWPLLRIMERLLGRADDVLINFSMKRARDHAWGVAQRLAPLTPADQEREIRALDERVVRIAGLVRRPGVLLNLATKAVRMGEWKTVRETIRILT